MYPSRCETVVQTKIQEIYSVKELVGNTAGFTMSKVEVEEKVLVHGIGCVLS